MVAKQVEGLEAGLYRYLPHDHRLLTVVAEDRAAALTTAANSQQSMTDAAAVIVVAAVLARTAVKYDDRAERYVQVEVGGVVQNVYLQAAAFGLGTVVLGSFDDDEVRQTLDLPAVESPMVLLPIGRPAVSS